MPHPRESASERTLSIWSCPLPPMPCRETRTVSGTGALAGTCTQKSSTFTSTAGRSLEERTGLKSTMGRPPTAGTWSAAVGGFSSCAETSRSVVVSLPRPKTAAKRTRPRVQELIPMGVNLLCRDRDGFERARSCSGTPPGNWLSPVYHKKHLRIHVFQKAIQTGCGTTVPMSPAFTQWRLVGLCRLPL